MIAANELRIGNLVEWQGEYRIISGVNKYKEVSLEKEGQYSSDGTHTDIVNPIPLTSKILEANGFHREEEDIFDLVWWRLVEEDFLLDENFSLVGQNVPPVKFVHDLQNLYFGLYKKELEIKL